MKMYNPTNDDVIDVHESNIEFMKEKGFTLERSKKKITDKKTDLQESKIK